MRQSGQHPDLPAAQSFGAEPATPARLAAVAFDMDGLLVDSEPVWFLAESAVMARLGGDWGPSDQYALIGGSLAVAVEYLLAKATRPAAPAVVARWLIEIMVEQVSTKPLAVLPGAASLLAEVQAARLPCALVTSSVAAVVDAVLARLEVRFDVVVCGADVARAKPDPEGYLLAAEKLGADPQRCIALEDSPNGVAAAEAAGYRVVAVPSVVPVPDRPGRVVLSTLAGVTLAELRARTKLGG
ncbi:MAG TPA: HAD family phosphatase [Streptosporangiaceae bacterium]|nr:HAD family phosphatase [Streptosporangiaceae bacterium]